MSHPSKTCSEAIVAAAAELIGRSGPEKVSLRAVARKLGLAPNALYYYFPNRKMLEAAVAAGGIRRMHAVLKRAAAGTHSADAVSRVCRAYLRFARAHPALYAMMMKKQPDSAGLPTARAELRDLLLGLFGSVGAPPAASKANFAPWALLHGLAELEREALLEHSGLSVDASFAISALLAGLSKT